MKEPTVADLTIQRDELVRCVHFALSHLYARGSGMLMDSSDAKAESWNLEHWTEWFVRAMKSVGIEIDTDLLEYQRASTTNRKKLLKENPALQEKLK